METSLWKFLIRHKHYLLIFVGSAYVVGFISPPPSLYEVFSKALYTGSLARGTAIVVVLLLSALSFLIIQSTLRVQYVSKFGSVLAGLFLLIFLTIAASFGYWTRVQLLYQSEIALRIQTNQPIGDILPPSRVAIVLTIASSVPLFATVYGYAIGSLAKVDYAKFHYWLDMMILYVDQMIDASNKHYPAKVQRSAEKFCEALANAITGIETTLPYEVDNYAQHIQKELLEPLKELQVFTQSAEFAAAPHIMMQLQPDYVDRDQWIANSSYPQSYQQILRFMNARQSTWAWITGSSRAST